VTISFSFPFVQFHGQLDNPNAIWPLAAYPGGIGEALVYLGIGGFVIVAYRWLRYPEHPSWHIMTLLLFWTLFLFIGSRLTSLSFPVRLARDLAVPLALLSGIFVQSVINFITARRLPWPWLWISLFLIACAAQTWQAIPDRLHRAFSPNPLISHLLVDTYAADYITKHLPLTATIYVFQDDIYLKDFTPLHRILKVDEPQKVARLLDATKGVEAIGTDEYLYVEERHDRPGNAHNNSEIAGSYIDSTAFRLVATFEQPEKKVYLFQKRAT
jgi:hypothetical protein